MTVHKGIPNPTPGQTALAGVNALAKELQACELETAKARARWTQAVLAAVLVAPQAEVARHAGVSKQRIGQMVKAAGE